MNVTDGGKAPNFHMKTDNQGEIKLSDVKGKNIVLYFYPKDLTPGWTKEACAFRENAEEFSKINTVIIGVSKDSVKRHDNFKAKYDLPFSLASDEDGKACEAYGTWVQKTMYGKKYMGIQRSTFLIDNKGVVRKIWRNVKVKGHVEDVLENAKSIWIMRL